MQVKPTQQEEEHFGEFDQVTAEDASFLGGVRRIFSVSDSKRSG